MRSHAIELRHLRYFIAVVEEGGLRAAALRLHISQPPLTRNIRALEDMLDTQLLVRHPHGVEVTAAGHEFYVEACNIVTLVERAARRVELIGRGHAGRLDVGVFGSPVFDFIPRVIGAFRHDNAHIEVALHTMTRSEQLKALRERRIDVGFNRFLVDEPGVRWRNVDRQTLFVGVSDQHRLAGAAELTLRQLIDEDLIFYPRGPRPGFMDHVLGVFARRGLVPQRITIVDDVPTAIAMVASGLGVTIIPSSATNLRLPNVRYIPFVQQDRETVDSCVIYRDEDPSALLQKFLDAVWDYADRVAGESAQSRLHGHDEPGSHPD
ncbi:MAG TPA: LysR family transcriptional regulator [Nevskiaceae bacterium]